MNKVNIGILFGGRSVEHEISVLSSKNVYDAMNKDKYNIIMIGITKEGRWVLNPETKDGVVKGKQTLALIPGSEGQQLIDISTNNPVEKLDAVFPILHGPYGEDGTMQGLLKILNIPFVGPSILSSAVSMDKEAMKRLLNEQQIPCTKYKVLYKYTETPNPTYEEISEEFGLPLFVKPASLGSSVGISKIESKDEFKEAVTEAFKYDLKLIVEPGIIGKEIECSVLGNEDPKASLPGEVRTNHSFYSYEAKYLDEHGAALDIPANLTQDIIKRIQETAVKAYKALYCEGLTRVDFFLTNNDELLINELNTIPGFTKISMYPKLWEVTGINYSDLIDRLIQLAIDRYNKETSLLTSI